MTSYDLTQATDAEIDDMLAECREEIADILSRIDDIEHHLIIRAYRGVCDGR
jgi:hypothetical protein